jgi:hypothetical protein
MAEPESARPLREFLTREAFEAWPLPAIVAFAARCARRVETAWAGLEDHERGQLERAIEIAERVGRGEYSARDARKLTGVNPADWSAQRPDCKAERTASGAAIFALACACCTTSEEAAVAAVLAAREAHFAAAGDAVDVETAEATVNELLRGVEDQRFQRTARAIRRDVERMRALAEAPSGNTRAGQNFFGPLWDEGAPAVTRS